MKWGLWSTTAASNSATPPDGWPEGQLPSTVNDCAREMMAQIRTGIQDVQFIDLGVTPTQTGNTTFTLAGNQMQWYQYGGRVKANVGGTLMYGTVISSSSTTNTGVTLRFDAGQGPLTNSLSAVSTGFPSPVSNALPEIVFRRHNPLMNATMDIWQRGAGPFSLSSANQVAGPDAWKVSLGIVTAGPTIAVSRGTNVPTVAQAGILLLSSLVISTGVALSSVSATDFCVIEQDIEGFDFRQIAQKPCTVTFWARSTLTGTYAMSIANTAGDRSMAVNFSISSAATWEQKTINFFESPTAGTWDYSTGVGLRVRITLTGGTNFQGGAGNWTAANVLCTSSNVNFLGGANRTFMLTGMQIDEGNYATPLEPVDYRKDFDRCKTRLNVLPGNTPRFFGHALNAGQAVFGYELDVGMRVPNPSISVLSALTTWVVTTGAGAILSVSSIVILNDSPASFSLLVTPVGGTGFTSGQGSMLFTSGAPATSLLLKAEL